eukprot:scaffold13016_cov154-Amphora_coffeaeformis.AAC.10
MWDESCVVTSEDTSNAMEHGSRNYNIAMYACPLPQVLQNDRALPTRILFFHERLSCVLVRVSLIPSYPLSNRPKERDFNMACVSSVRRSPPDHCGCQRPETLLDAESHAAVFMIRLGNKQ